jgi:hypothetical protein
VTVSVGIRHTPRRWIAGAAVAIATCAIGASSRAAVLDRVVARFADPESADAGGTRFVTMRELILEAWIVAYERAAPGETPSGFDDKQLRAALERHVIEEVLSERLPSSTPPAKVQKGADAARLALRLVVDDRVDEILSKASGGAPGGGVAELESILMRRARAETYLEVAVAEPVDVTEGELRAAWAHPPKMLEDVEFEKAVPALRVLVRSTRLREAAQAYYQAVRARLHLEISGAASNT